MQAETVYEFGSSPDEEDYDNNVSRNAGPNEGGQSSSSSPYPNKPNSQRKKTSTHHQSSLNQQHHHPQQQQQQPTTIAGTNLRPNKTSSTSINQKLNTSFSSLSDNQPPSSSHSPINPIKHHQSKASANLKRHHLDHGNNDISSSDDQLLLNDNNTKLVTTNTSNTSLSSATTSSSRANTSQSGHQSLPILTKGASGHQATGAGSIVSGSSQQQSQNANFDSNVISERVKNLATQIYQELKRIISRCNYDEDILSGLMPLIVRVLESLDLAIIENQQLQVELELCKDDNDQLVIMFEKEKAAKRAIDKKLIESEYAYEEERQQHQQKIESLDNVVKMFELKTKNASDQAARFEEKESERKKEYNKLHDRYTELLKSHCDVVERFRHLAGNNEAVANLTSINVPPQQILTSSSDLSSIHDVPSLYEKMKLKAEDFAVDSQKDGQTTKTSTLKSWNADTELTLEDASLVVIDEMLEQHKAGDGSSQNESSVATHETVGTTVSGSGGEGEHEKEAENDSIAYTSMEKEFRKLIQENKDLLNTKNALNVVKDDLIAEVDRLTNEVSMYEQAVEQLNGTKDQMKQKVFALDAELRKTKEELEKAKQKIRENNEEGVPYSQRKRFGRAEMAKVLMERNNFKEKFMELQDAVRYTELVRANKVETEKRSGLWKFFSNLFGAPPPLAIGPGSQTLSRNSSPVVSYHGSTALAASAAITASDQQILTSTGGSNQLLTATSDALLKGAGGAASGVGSATIRTTSQRLSSNSDLIVLMDSDINVDRSHIFKSDGRLNSDLSSGYIHAYGWTLPASSVKSLTTASSATSTATLGLESTPSVDNFAGGLHRGILASSNPSSFNIATDHQSEPIGSGIGNQSGMIDGVVGGGAFSNIGSKLSGLQVPIPQYCRPLTGDSLGMKIWCATAIDLSGGYNQQQYDDQASKSLVYQDQQQQQQGVSQNCDSSGSIVNISTSTPIKSTPRGANQNALRMLEKEVDEALNVDTDHLSTSPTACRQLPILKTTTDMVLSALPMVEDTEELSSCVWICSTQHSRSKITIIDIKTKPNELLDSFYVPTFLYCIKSIPGSKLSDIPNITSLNHPPPPPPPTSNQSEQLRESNVEPTQVTQKGTSNSLMNMIDELISNQKREFYRLIAVDMEAESKLRKSRLEAAKMAASKSDEENKNNSKSTLNESQDKRPVEVEDAEISRILDNNVSVGIATLQKLHDFVAHTQPVTTNSTKIGDEIDDQPETSSSTNPTRTEKQPNTTQTQTGLPEKANEIEDSSSNYKDVVYYQPISTSLSTVWMGGKDSILYIHSAIGQWKDCVACVKLPDSILQICHFRGKVFVALADGSLCVFFRNIETKQWDFSQYLLIDINLIADAVNDTIGVDLHQNVPSSHNTDNQQQRKQQADSSLTNTNSATPTKTPSTSANLAKSKVSATTASSSSSSSSSSRPKTKVAGIRCLEIANRNLWVGHKNRVLIIDPITLKLKQSFNVVPQVDNQIRQLISMKDGVFVCLRSDLILRLYSSIKPYQHIQNIDIEPVVTRLISPKTFVISHITAMKVANNTLWIGNAHGIILTIPCKLVPQISEAPVHGPDGEYQETPSSLSIARFIPKCDITNAQISFHGHKDAVKFFINAHNLMLSGGQGYLDFRLDMDDQSKSISDKSHLILWQLPH